TRDSSPGGSHPFFRAASASASPRTSSSSGLTPVQITRGSWVTARDRAVFFGEGHAGRVAPQALEQIVLARLWMENVDHDVHEVEQHPAPVLHPLHVPGARALLLHLLPHVVGDGPHLRLRERR